MARRKSWGWVINELGEDSWRIRLEKIRILKCASDASAMAQAIMQTVDVADLKKNLSAWLERVRNGEELVVIDRNTPIARLLPPDVPDVFDTGEEDLVAAGLMRLPLDEKNDYFLDFPAPEVSLDAIRAAIRGERDAN